MMQQQRRMEQYDDDIMELERVAKESNDMIDETIVPTKRNISEPKNNIMGSISNSREQKGIKENKKVLAHQLSEKDGNSTTLSSDYRRKIQELEAELEKRKESEANLFDTLVMQSKQLDMNKILLEESKLEISTLEEKLRILHIGESEEESEGEEEKLKGGVKSKKEGEGDEEKLKGGVKSKKEGEGDEEEEEELSIKAKTLLEELNLLKSELDAATKAEANSKKAMDDLAFALKEVATEANQIKTQLTLSQVELEHTKGEVEKWKTMSESTEQKFKELLEATQKEADRYKNTAERLRLEAEESLLAWNGKETEFVNCIKKTEEERLLAQQETIRVLELLKEAEDKTMVSKEENQKLRDILKQALNESNVAKEAAEIAKAENARLQDSLNLLVHENEMLKIHEAASFENIKELKRMVSESSSKEFKFEDMERFSTKEGSKEDKELSKKTKEHKESKSLSKTFSLNLKDMITTHKPQPKLVSNEDVANKEPQADDDTLKGSIFDEVDSSSDSESRHDLDDFEHLDESHFDESDSGSTRKRKALLRRFGDLIRRRE